jgi:hypothetical protein
VSYRAGAPIAGIVARSGAVDRVLMEGDVDPAYDVVVSVGDLPHLLRIGGDVPPPLALPVPEQGRVDAARRLAALGPPPTIGLTWRAGTREWNALLKEVPAADLGAALRGVPATFVALQRAPDPGEIDALASALGAPVHDLSALNRDLDAMLAVLAELDVYIGVSNTNTHLRAGTGRPSHVLVPHPPEWRWMHAGERSPWFPQCPLYREARTTVGWKDALAMLGRDILAPLSKG